MHKKFLTSIFFKTIASPQGTSAATTSLCPKNVEKMLISFGCKEDQITQLYRDIQTHSKAKTKLEITNSILVRNGSIQYIHLTIQATKGEEVSNMQLPVTIPTSPFDARAAETIASIEAKALVWAFDHQLYSPKTFPILVGTNCTGLVYNTYAKAFQEAYPDQPDTAHALLETTSKWMMALFANDEARDLQLYEDPSTVKRENEELILALREIKGAQPQTSKASAMLELLKEYDVILSKANVKNIPALKEQIIESLERYLGSTVLEASFKAAYRSPTTVNFDVIKGESSGSNHAILLGAALCRQLIKAGQFDAETVCNQYTAKVVETTNDSYSEPKELRAACKELKQLLEEAASIDTPLPVEVTPHLEVEGGRQRTLSESRSNFYTIAKVQLRAACKKFLQNESSSLLTSLLTSLLDTIPSFNRVTCDTRKMLTGETNESRAKENIIALLEGEVDTLLVLKLLREGWGSQVIWAVNALRYSEGRPLSEAEASLFQFLETKPKTIDTDQLYPAILTSSQNFVTAYNHLASEFSKK